MSVSMFSGRCRRFGAVEILTWEKSGGWISVVTEKARSSPSEVPGSGQALNVGCKWAQTVIFETLIRNTADTHLSF